ncbi:hypothetical protein BASA60_000402 [Batrachochytrium salamandrivorans]|nr:hypothetical protein BASA60_000402 [Batrachochytrium salamandrivorans]
MIIIELHKLLLLDLLDIADCLAPFRLIPTGLLGLVHMVYKIGWSLSKQHRGIPIIFWLSGIPELFLVLFFVIMSAVYVAGYLATGGNMRFRLNQLSEGVTLRDDFKIAIRKFAILISQHRPTHSGFSKELHPIFAPAGIGLPPAALINVHARPTGFRLNLDECENRQRATAWEKTIRALEIHELFATVLNSVYMWRCALMAMFRPMSVFVQDLLRRVLAPSMSRTGLGSAETRSKYKVDLSSEGRISYDDEDGNTFSDLDFELDGTDTSSNWSCELDNENSTETQQNDSVIHPDGDDDDDNDDDDLCKEIFWLAQDMQSSSSDTLGAASNAMTLSPEIHTAVTPTSLISLTQVLQQTLFEVGVMTRSQRRRLNSGPESTVSTSGGLDQHHTRIWHGATSTKAVPMDDQSSINDSSVRLCVVCQQEPRCIVLRPCGCLCLCDSGCREALALRDYKECPCCRRSVKGYQKIYEP